MLATEDVEAAARKAAFQGAQIEIKQLLVAHGFAERLGISLDGDLNEDPEILTTSVVKEKRGLRRNGVRFAFG